MTIVGIRARRSGTAARNGKRPPIVPLFVVGFVLAVLVASSGVLPEPVMGALGTLETWCLSMAMFALGLGVKAKELVRGGFKPVLLGAISTVVVAATALGGVLVVT